MQISKAQIDDADALAQLRREAILALAGPTLSPEQAAHWANSAPADRCARAIREHAVWVASDGVPSGWVEVDGDRVAALYVAPGRARRGVGSALLAHAETAIQSAGCRVARLGASPNALGFYLRRGYRRDGPPDATGTYPLRKPLAALDHTPDPA